MAQPKSLGPGQSPDASYFLGRWYVSWQHGATLHLVSLLPGTLEEVSWNTWTVGEPGVFARLIVWKGRLFFAHRDGTAGYRIALRVIGSTSVEYLDVEGTSEADLGHGADPVALGEGYVAWQATGAPEYQVWRRPLVGSESAQYVRNGRPTGLSRVLAGGVVKTVDEDREALTGYTRPCWAGDLTVAEGRNLGAYARLTDGRELTLWQGQEAVTPRCAWDGADRYLIATWSAREGVRAAEVTRAEFMPPKPLEPVLDTTSVVDVIDYLPIGYTLDGAHLLAFRLTGQSPNVFSIAKHEDGGGEWWAYDDQWVYHHLDQAGSPIEEVISGTFTPRTNEKGIRVDAYHFSPDARWMPRHAKTGSSVEMVGELHHQSDGQRVPWRYVNAFEVYSSWPTPHGPMKALRMRCDPRTARDPNGRLKGGYEFWTFCHSDDRSQWYVTWEQWRTKNDNSGDEPDKGPNGLPLFREFSGPIAANVAWRPSRRPANATLLPAEDDMNAPGVTIDRYGPVIGPTGTWSVEWHDRNNSGVSGKVEIVNGSVHVTIINPEGSDRSGNRRPVEIRA